MGDLHFDGSIWCNIDVALRNLDLIYKRETEALGLTVIEWHVMHLLYEKDGNMPSRLADGVGRPATSFTPILDKLESKGFIERRSDPADRRAVRIYLTKQGRTIEEQVKASAVRIEAKLRQQVSDKNWQSFQNVIQSIQSINP